MISSGGCLLIVQAQLSSGKLQPPHMVLLRDRLSTKSGDAESESSTPPVLMNQEWRVLYIESYRCRLETPTLHLGEARDRDAPRGPFLGLHVQAFPFSLDAPNRSRYWPKNL